MHDGSGWLALAHVGHVDGVRDLADLLRQVLLAAAFEKRLELFRHIEVIFDRILAPAGDQNDVGHAGGDGLFDTILNGRLVHQRQHFFGLRLGRRKEARAESGGREDGLSNGRSHSLLE